MLLQFRSFADSDQPFETNTVDWEKNGLFHKPYSCLIVYWRWVNEWLKIVFNLFITEQSIFDASHTSASLNGAFEHITIYTMTGDIMSPSHHYINLLYAPVIYMHEPNGISSKWIDDSVYIILTYCIYMSMSMSMNGRKKRRWKNVRKGQSLLLL